ncbi:MAG: FlgD immunoglobulin-like domain containing protein, partial [Saprospiraceae bacterium]
YPTVFDKPTALQTLGQGPQNIPIKTFEVQKSVIFKGESTIKDGQFEFSFVVPKDIDYDFGHGKISLYATDGIDRDAAGSYDSLVIGGAEENSTDDTPPIVGVYINSFHFRSGGITAPKPTLLLDLRDDSGINVSGTSIGHDLTATIDGDENSKIVLNDFFRAALDDHTRGTVEYPLNIEKPGTYTIHVKAWDSANNSAVGTTTFKIIIEDRPIITDLTTYPNPFTQSTCISFEHNLNQIQAMAEVTIFDQLGRKVKTLRQELLGGSSSEPCILWDGTGDDGNQLAHGIYVYRVSIVLPADSGFASPKNRDAKFGKVVLLK